jgi:hypothetical protein
MKKQVVVRWLVTLLVSVFIAILGIRVNCQAEEEATPQESVISPQESVISPQESVTSLQEPATSPHEPVTLTKRLSAGWNLISMEVSPGAFQDVEGMCKDINDQGGGCVEIDGWIGGGWSRYICGYLENDFPIQEGSFYFIKCEMPSEWKVSGSVSQLSSSASGSESKSKADGGSTSSVEGVDGVELPYGSLLSQDGTLSGIPGSLTPDLAPALTPYDASCGWLRTSPNVYLYSGADNVGIGTTAPDRKLTVYNASSAYTNVKDGTHEILTGVDSSGGIVSVMTNHDLILRAGANSEKMRIKANGNVGIGTASPSAKLHVAGSNPEILLDNTAASTSKMRLLSFTAGDTWIQSGTDWVSGSVAPIRFSGIYGTPVHMSILGNGNVGIGTTNPGYKLTVSGTTNLSRDGAGECCSGGDFTLALAESTRNNDSSINTGHRATIQFHNGWEAEGFMRLASGGGSQPAGVPGSQNITDRRFIFGSYQTNMSGEFTGNLYANGNVGIGTTSPSCKLQVAGDAMADHWYTPSDSRLKKDVTTVDHALDKVSALRGVEFRWRTEEYPDKGFDEGKKIGLIAQEVEKVLPEVVSTDNKGYKSVEYANIVGVLIEAVKDLKVQNEALKALVCQDHPEAEICQ